MNEKMNQFRRLALCGLVFLLHLTRAAAQSDPATEKKIDDLIGKMTLEEKVSMIHANSAFTTASVPRLGIPELVTSDGPHGVRPEQGRYWVQTQKILDSGTYLPTGVCLAATWNPELGYAFGSVLGSEANFRGKDVILGPGINIMRSPLNGRNFEYESEDPFLISKMVVGYVRGVQDQGISACVKHFMGNNQETLRGSIDVQMSERALREIYLPGFRAAVTEGHVNTLMGSYNKFRGQWCTHNDYLINKILKGEWKFDGLVMSDWGAVHFTREALLNGTDLEMGTDLGMPKPRDYHKFFMGDTVISLVKSGQIRESVVDEKVRRILRVMFRTHMMDHGRKKGEYNTPAHQQTALKVAEEGIVLLKNDDHILPLDKASIKSIAVIGVNAARPQAGGGGSSQIKAFYEITPLKGLQTLAGEGIRINYSQGYRIERGARADEGLIKEAAAAAAAADVAIVVGGWTHGYNYSVWSDNAYDAEDIDKPDMRMPFGQDELIRAVLKANPKTIVVLIGGGPIDMTEWVDQAKGIVQAWYPGMEGGNALAKILFGKVNPSGKLPVSFPRKLEDCPAHKLGEFPGDGTTVKYNDDIFVGYRYYDTYHVQPLFPFGYGLSYTTFGYSNLKVATDGGKTVVSFVLKNTGSVSGAEVAELYVKEEKSELPRPDKELKGFSKVFLLPGEEKIVTISLDASAFQYYNDKLGKWVEEPGVYDVLVGGSSRDIRVMGKITR
jgi:beta-glucosidase